MYKNVSDKFKGEKGVLSRGRTNIGYIQPINENTISGTSVSIIDGIKDKTELTIDGKSTQETRSGKNLLNVETTTPKKYISRNNGNVGNSDDWSATDFIPIEASTTYILSGIRNGGSNVAGTAYYDKDKN